MGEVSEDLRIARLTGFVPGVLTYVGNSCHDMKLEIILAFGVHLASDDIVVGIPRPSEDWKPRLVNVRKFDREDLRTDDHLRFWQP